MPNKSDSSASLSRNARRAAARAARRAGPGAFSGAALALSLGMTPADARANTFQVTNLNASGAGSLAQAVIDANANPDADEITFQSGLSGTINLAGQLNITESVTITGPGADALTVSGGNSSRVFYLFNKTNDLDVSISGLTAANGRGQIGAAVIDWGENMTLDSVKITGSVATETASGFNGGGGVYIAYESADVVIRNAVISGNTSAKNGGGIYLYNGSLVLEDSVVSDNQATSFANAKGGGINLRNPKAVTIERSTISGNSASGSGGGVYIMKAESGAVFAVKDSTVSGNDAVSGGGVVIGNPADPAAIENCTISGNHATAGDGGGISLLNVTAGISIHNSTIASNSASGAGGGISVTQGAVTLADTIVGDNTAASNADVTGSLTAAYSLIEATGTATITDDGGNVTGMDAALGALANNGGPTQTHLPGANSPALDSGDPAFASPPATDQRGLSRVSGVHIDIGAVERNPGTLQCSMADVAVDENDGHATIVVTRTGGADGAISVDYATANGTAKQPGDYTTTTGTLNWSSQDSASKMFQVPLKNDTVPEASETFTASISNPTDGSKLGAVTTATVTIADDDAGKAPTISAIPDQKVDEDQATSAIPFTIADSDTALAKLTLTAKSSNHTLVPDANIVLTGSGKNRTVKVTPLANEHGTADVTITVSDGSNVASEVFSVTVKSINDAPTISTIDDQTIDKNTSTAALAFTIGDPDNDAADLTVSAKSSKQSVVANAGITLSGSGTNRTVKVAPVKDATGVANVVVTVGDGKLTTATTFKVTVATRAGTGGTGGTGGIAGMGGSMMEPDAGTAGGSGGANGGAGMGAAGDASVDAGDVADAGMAPAKKHDGGCSTTGTGEPAGFFMTVLLGIAGLVSRRRR